MSAPEAPPAGGPAGAVRRPLARRSAVAGLLALLGFVLAAELHRSSGAGPALSGVRQDDLVRILAQTDAERQREQSALSALQALQARLASATTRRAAALDAERQQRDQLAVLAGTAPLSGPGVELRIDDPRRGVRADLLLDAVEELRDAGAAALQVGSVRVVAQTWLLDAPTGGVDVDGTVLQPPYRIVAVGDPRTLAAALAIPGGVQDATSRAGASLAVTSPARVSVSALRPLRPLHYAHPAAG